MKPTTILVVVVLWLAGFSAMAQMPNDPIYLGKKLSCTALMAGQSTWTTYWENSLKRENFNIGTHTTRSLTLMTVYGLTKRVNLIASVPYIQTSTSAGNLLGQKGIQDLSVFVKVKAVSYKGLSLNAVVGGSIPLGNYVPDFLPMSIGLQCRTATGRVIAAYREPRSGVYVTTVGSYIWRSNITVDRDAYQANDRVYNTNQVGMPDAWDLGAHLGVLRKTWQGEVFAERTGCTNGDYIRRNDMPFPTNNMNATTVGAYAKYEPGKFGVNARVGYVVDGRNVGQSTSYMVGLLYQIQFK
jgi:hypothetical protein